MPFLLFLPLPINLSPTLQGICITGLRFYMVNKLINFKKLLNLCI